MNGCMSSVTVVSSSGFRFDDSNYDYTNSNTNCSSHLCYFFQDINPANMAKNHGTIESVGSASENDFKSSKA